MRDPKSLFILILALSLVIISFVLISIWGYHFYIEPKENATSQPVNKSPLNIQKPAITDSLKSLRDSTNSESVIQQNNPVLNSSDSSDKTLELKLLQYNQLKEDIAEILKNKTSSSKDKSDANAKIAQLQKSIDDLRNQNDAVVQENARLSKMLKQFMAENKHKSNSDVKSTTKKIKKNEPASPSLLVYRLKFFAVDKNKSLTDQASDAIRLEGSFQINVKSDNNIPNEIYIVIIQPNGRVLLNTPLNSGMFEVDSVKKIYSAVLHFDTEKDNHRRLYFSIPSHTFHKGEYTMKIYHNGILIGRMERSLG